MSKGKMVLFASLVGAMVLVGCEKKEENSSKEAKSATETSALVAQKTCPVMGNAITKELYADYRGQRVYFCCQGCVEPFNKEPEKYIKKLKELGEKPEKL